MVNSRWEMYKIIKLLKEKQSGQALVIALAALGLGGLMIAPMLSFMGTGLDAGVIAEDKTDELYACDAGVQDAIWQVNNIGEFGLAIDGVQDLIPIGDGGDWYYYSSDEELLINNKEVHVGIRLLYPLEGFGVYQIHSWVGSDDFVDADTRIDAIITTTWIDYSEFLNNVITSGNDITGPDPGGNPPTVTPGEGEPNGPIENYGDELWPEVQEIIDYYMQYVDPVADLHSDSNFNVRDLPLPRTIDAVYRDGDLRFTDSGGGSDVDVSINGTIYVAGADSELDVATGNKTLFEFVVPDDDISGAVMFSEGEIIIGPNSHISGKGCIIAVGDIDFQPTFDGDDQDFIFVISLTGTVHFAPQNKFFGAVAGKGGVDGDGVELWPGTDIAYGNLPAEVNWPGGGGELIWGVQTWLYNETYDIP
jgi:hypothetical protein